MDITLGICMKLEYYTNHPFGELMFAREDFFIQYSSLEYVVEQTSSVQAKRALQHIIRNYVPAVVPVLPHKQGTPGPGFHSRLQM